MNHKEKSKQALRNLGGLAKAHNITQGQLAEKLGVRQQTVGQTFNARFHPTLDNVYRYLDAINELAGAAYTLADIDYKRDIAPQI